MGERRYGEPDEPGKPWIFPIRVSDLPDDGYLVASWWANREVWGTIGERPLEGELAELSAASLVSMWTCAAIPVLIHTAFLSGATAGEVIEATTASFEEVVDIWLRWVIPLRQQWEAGDHVEGISPEETDAVLAQMGFGGGDAVNPYEI